MLKYFKPATRTRSTSKVAFNRIRSPVKIKPTHRTCSGTGCCNCKRELSLDRFELTSNNEVEDKSNQHKNCHQPSKKLRTERILQEKPLRGLPCRKLSAENLDCDYVQLYGRREALELFDECERELEYFTGELTRVQVYGKWHSIRRKQVAHGDSGLTYKYSGVTVPAKPWTPLVQTVRGRLEEVTGQRFNFVLINRYKDGSDYMGEHRDDEKELIPTSPIASLSLGQPRDFVFRHGESRGKNAKRNLPPIRIELGNGSLLMMNYPTNVYWYHSLPVRKKVVGVRINMTFRCLKT